MTPIETSAETATVVESPAESLAPFGSVVALETFAVAGMFVPSGVPGATVTVSEKTAVEPLASTGAVHVTGPVPPIGGDVQFQPTGDETTANVVPGGVDCVIDTDCASLGPAFVTLMA